MASSASFPPNYVLYQDHPISPPFKDSLPVLPAPRLSHDVLRSSVLALRPFEQDDLLTSRSGLDGYNQFVYDVNTRRLPLPADIQVRGDPVLFTCGINDQWIKRKEILQFIASRSSEVDEDLLDPSIMSDSWELQAVYADEYSEHFDFQTSNWFGPKESFHGTNWHTYVKGTNCGHLHDGSFPASCVYPDGRLPFVGIKTDMKDLDSVLADFAITKDSARWTKPKMLVPHFRWNDVCLPDTLLPSSLILETVTASPLKSAEKVKLKSIPGRKAKKAARDRDLYRNNSFYAFETVLSLMVDKKRNGRSIMKSLKKSGPELPHFLTRFSASISGTGLAVLFSVLYKVACGSPPLCTSNLLTFGFGVALFCLSLAVNRLRNTVICISKNFSKSGLEEAEMMSRVDKSLNDIVFNAAASVAVLVLWFA